MNKFSLSLPLAKVFQGCAALALLWTLIPSSPTNAQGLFAEARVILTDNGRERPCYAMVQGLDADKLFLRGRSIGVLLSQFNESQREASELQKLMKAPGQRIPECVPEAQLVAYEVVKSALQPDLPGAGSVCVSVRYLREDMATGNSVFYVEDNVRVCLSNRANYTPVSIMSVLGY